MNTDTGSFWEAIGNELSGRLERFLLTTVKEEVHVCIGAGVKRSDLHSKFGGQAQGGISTPVQHPFMLLFTSETGKHYGYEDGWSKDDAGIYLYTGEGQVGDMEFTPGNAAIRDHVENGKDLHLFSYIRKAYVRYTGQMICIGHQLQLGTDRDGKPRQVIIFG